MSAMVSQITSLTIAYSTVYSGIDQRKKQGSASLALVRGIQPWPVNSPHKEPAAIASIWWCHRDISLQLKRHQTCSSLPQHPVPNKEYSSIAYAKFCVVLLMSFFPVASTEAADDHDNITCFGRHRILLLMIIISMSNYDGHITLWPHILLLAEELKKLYMAVVQTRKGI